MPSTGSVSHTMLFKWI